jgi:hypothetical protein
MHPAAKKRPTLRIEQPPPPRLILPQAKKTLGTAQGAGTKFFGRNWGGVGSGCVGMRHGPRSVQVSPKKESAQCILNAQRFLRGQHPHAFDHPLATRPLRHLVQHHPARLEAAKKSIFSTSCRR